MGASLPRRTGRRARPRPGMGSSSAGAGSSSTGLVPNQARTGTRRVKKVLTPDRSMVYPGYHLTATHAHRQRIAWTRSCLNPCAPWEVDRWLSEASQACLLGNGPGSSASLARCCSGAVGAPTVACASRSTKRAPAAGPCTTASRRGSKRVSGATQELRCIGPTSTEGPAGMGLGAPNLHRSLVRP